MFTGKKIQDNVYYTKTSLYAKNLHYVAISNLRKFVNYVVMCPSIIINYPYYIKHENVCMLSTSNRKVFWVFIDLAIMEENTQLSLTALDKAIRMLQK